MYDDEKFYLTFFVEIDFVLKILDINIHIIFNNQFFS